METSNDKKAVLTLDTKNKVLTATLRGYFRPQDANNFLDQYNENLKQIDTKEYELHFAAKEMKVNSQDMLPMLTACFEMYKKDGFKKIVFDCGDSATLKMQLRRVAENVKLLNYEIL